MTYPKPGWPPTFMRPRLAGHAELAVCPPPSAKRPETVSGSAIAAVDWSTTMKVKPSRRPF
jgi:hypothetical protein